MKASPTLSCVHIRSLLLNKDKHLRSSTANGEPLYQCFPPKQHLRTLYVRDSSWSHAWCHAQCELKHNGSQQKETHTHTHTPQFTHTRAPAHLCVGGEEMLLPPRWHPAVPTPACSSLTLKKRFRKNISQRRAGFCVSSFKPAERREV